MGIYHNWHVAKQQAASADDETQQALQTPVAAILTAAPIEDSQRADLWDAFHAKNSHEFGQYLQPLDIPEQLKAELYQEKTGGHPALSAAARARQKSSDPVEATIQVMHKLSKVDPRALDLAEKHHEITKHLIGAVTKSETK